MGFDFVQKVERMIYKMSILIHVLDLFKFVPHAHPTKSKYTKVRKVLYIVMQFNRPRRFLTLIFSNTMGSKERFTVICLIAEKPIVWNCIGPSSIKRIKWLDFDKSNDCYI